ncbi:tryptophan synthase subunit alpha [Desertivirga brevis]|uniref:tryptophan synthase subunit alpha n=1 Tax=Desertivirga brevis TaxID=2810310 RepID=UPI001A97103D|nr:tryptophan synthase subunit alpha [Pedobacter sp. SYSU D00873]
MNRINQLFKDKKSDILNIFFTAGFPHLNDTRTVLKHLENAGVDLVEIGMPYSDPLADGPVIQESNMVAINNGMSIELLFQQLEGFRKEINIPVLLMGYYNPVIQYGVEAFIRKASELGIDGIIIPDLPLKEYETKYRHLFEKYNLSNVFLVTPQTTPERLFKIDSISNGFIYVVSTNSTTGNSEKAGKQNDQFLENIKQAPLNNPRLIGFNIKDKASYRDALRYAPGAIIGTAFIRLLEQSKNYDKDIHDFVHSIKGLKLAEHKSPSAQLIVF